MNLKEKVDQYFKLQEEIHEYFGYVEDWVVIPLDYALDYHWFIDGTDTDGTVVYSKDPLTKNALMEGKTIYIVDIGFTDTHQFLTELQKVLSERYPATNWIVRTKIGTYFADDPELWTEIKEKGHGMIMGVGH